MTDRTAAVGGRDMYRIGILRDRAAAEISEAGAAFHINEYVFLGRASGQLGIIADILHVRLSDPRG